MILIFEKCTITLPSLVHLHIFFRMIVGMQSHLVDHREVFIQREVSIYNHRHILNIVQHKYDYNAMEQLMCLQM